MNQPIHSRRRSNNNAIPDVIFVLLLLNVAVFAAQQAWPLVSSYYFALWPVSRGAPFEFWQLISYGFMHGNLTHIAFNMFGLWMFGQDLERLWGAQRFLTFYLICVVGAGLIQLLVAHMQNGAYPTVGASGGLFGILLAYGLTFPNRVIVPLFPPIPMRAITFVVLFGGFELLMGVGGARTGIAHFAHVGGMLFGFLVLQFWARRRRR